MMPLLADIFQSSESRAILAARVFVIGHYLGLDWLDCRLNATLFFRRCFELDPTNAAPFSDYGSFLYELQRYEESISCLLRSVELGHDQVYLLLGVLYHTMGDVTEARESVEMFLARNPPHMEPHTSMANYFLHNLGKVRSADENALTDSLWFSRR